MIVKDAIFRLFWFNLKNNSIILELLGLSLNASDIEKRKKICPFPPSDYINLPKIIIGEVWFGENKQFKFLRDIHLEVHVWSNDETLETHRNILREIELLIDGEQFEIDSQDDLGYLSEFRLIQGGTLPLWISDLYDFYNTYVVVVSPKKNKKLY